MEPSPRPRTAHEQIVQETMWVFKNKNNFIAHNVICRCRVSLEDVRQKLDAAIVIRTRGNEELKLLLKYAKASRNKILQQALLAYRKW
jgi:hypothetical protein